MKKALKSEKNFVYNFFDSDRGGERGVDHQGGLILWVSLLTHMKPTYQILASCYA